MADLDRATLSGRPERSQWQTFEPSGAAGVEGRPESADEREQDPFDLATGAP